MFDLLKMGLENSATVLQTIILFSLTQRNLIGFGCCFIGSCLPSSVDGSSARSPVSFKCTVKPSRTTGKHDLKTV